MSERAAIKRAAIDANQAIAEELLRAALGRLRPFVDELEIRTEDENVKLWAGRAAAAARKERARLVEMEGRKALGGHLDTAEAQLSAVAAVADSIARTGHWDSDLIADIQQLSRGVLRPVEEVAHG